MAKKQTRRSVSIRGTTYDTVRAYCEQNGLSMSEFMEERIAGFFSADSAPGNTAQKRQVKQAEKRSAPPRKSVARVAPSAASLNSNQLHDAARHFTF